MSSIVRVSIIICYLLYLILVDYGNNIFSFEILECGLPPEYCMFGQKDSSACQEWLKANHPALYNEIYNPDGAVASAEVPVQDSAAGDDAATNEAGEPTGEN